MKLLLLALLFVGWARGALVTSATLAKTLPAFPEAGGDVRVLSWESIWLADDLPQIVVAKVRTDLLRGKGPGFRSLAFVDDGARSLVYDSGGYQTGCGESDWRFGEHRLLSLAGKRLFVLEVVDHKAGCVDTGATEERQWLFFDADAKFRRVLELEKQFADPGKDLWRDGWLRIFNGDEGDPVDWLDYSRWTATKKDGLNSQSPRRIGWDASKSKLELKPWK